MASATADSTAWVTAGCSSTSKCRSASTACFLRAARLVSWAAAAYVRSSWQPCEQVSAH